VPLPLGHTAIGLAIHEMSREKDCTVSWWKIAAFVTVLANLPDWDVLLGLFLEGNGWTFHRGPTHSLVFALSCGYFASKVWKVWPGIPKVPFFVVSW